MDGLWKHDPLYPTECDNNGNINNVIVITESQTVETTPPPAVESRQGDDSPTVGEKISADIAVISGARPGDDVVSSQERSDNVSQTATPLNIGDCPGAPERKAELRTDIASLSCKSQGKSLYSEHKSRGKDLL